ncbi:MAG: ATP-binding protein [Xanthomonadales bacterium]|nr:ATP-binding protein [Xanthomonadales bacterium]
MRLRNQLLALSLLTLLLPWSGWKLVQELENFLRQAEENALLVSGQTLTQVLPLEYQAELRLARGQALPLRQLAMEPIADGYITDWPEANQNLSFESSEGLLKLDLLAGRYGSHFYLAVKVTDPGEIRATAYNTGASDASQAAGVMLYVQSNRGQFSYMISSEAPGPLTVNSKGGNGTRLNAAWMDDANGYTVELTLPGDVERISIGAVAPAFTMQGISYERHAGTLNGRQKGQWLELISRDDGVSQWLAKIVPENTRAWLVQADGWVVADSGPVDNAGNSELTWVKRMLYQAVADSDMPFREDPPPWPVRFEGDAINVALLGGYGTLWNRDAESAAVYNLVAIPVFDAETEGSGSGGKAIGAVVLETRSEGLLLMTNRALGRFSIIALLLVLVLAAGLWLFASRLSHRVQKLSTAVSRAMDDGGRVSDIPLTTSADELGELARNTEKLLKAVTEHTGYLQKLASRLSHELKTPIAITRSSLENLASSDLDPTAHEYLSRAQEGLDRQAAIVSAMSEAQRLEGSVKTADWETINLGEMLSHSIDAYRSVNPLRKISLNLPNDDCRLHCAPDLIVQALDKLVDNAISLSARDCEIAISLRHEERAFLICVANSGTRLPDVLHDRLFDSLVSLREKQASGQHLGLGLHIVRLVAEAHGGKVSAGNLPNDAGVEFTIELPAD